MSTFLDKNDLYDAYLDSQVWARDFQAPFKEIERISANKIRKGIAPNFPKINDGTISSQLPEMAMRRLPQLFTGRFYVPGVPAWFVEVVNILWGCVLVPGAKTSASFYVKLWNMFYASGRYGAAGAFAFFRNDPDYTGADWRPLYIKDIKPESGKTSVHDGNFTFVDFYFTKLDMLKLIADGEQEDADAKKDKRESFNLFDTKALKDYVNAGPEGKEPQDKSQTEEDHEAHQYKPYKLSTCFHKGFEAPFYTIIPAMGGQLVRTRKNENPSGVIPVPMMYAIQNLENPYGRGVVEQAAGSQNYLDLLTQSDALATQIAMEPPVDIHGPTDGLRPDTIKFGPRRKWYTGSASVSVVKTNTDAYAQIDTRIARTKASVMNHLGSFDASISAAAGDPQFSRTPAGVKFQGGRMSDTDNFYINGGREFYGNLAEILMNIHLANMKGTEAQNITDEQAESLIRAGWNVGKSRTVKLNYDEYNDIKTSFKTDPPTGAYDQEKEDLLEGIKLVVENAETLPQLQSVRLGDYELKVGEMFARYFQKLKIDQLDKVLVKVTPDATGYGSTDGVSGGDGGAGADTADLQAEHQQTMEQYKVDANGAEIIMVARRKGMSEQEIADRIAQIRANQSQGATA